MAVSTNVRESDFLEALIPSYEAEGFSVFLHPPREMLPPFMRGYQPDAIALKDDRKIAIEIKRDIGQTTAARIEQLHKMFSGHPEWELRPYYLPSRPEEEDIQVSDILEIDHALAEVEELKRGGHLRAALMMAWATLEAAGRALLPQNLRRPQPASSLVEVLASEGVITPTEADSLRKTVNLRNAASHGHFALPITERQVDEIVSTARLITGNLAQHK
jgi:uncharacterized protein YutE (UPF0331/DUF86 family)